MRPFPFVSRNYWYRVLRVILGLSMTAHGFYRILEIGMSNFGEFLSLQGFPCGFFLGWCITIFEITGGTALTFAYFRRPLCAVFIFELLIGMMLVNGSAGWIDAGYTTARPEYNTLLIICFSLIASDD